jgi:hypothetical protein
MLLNLTDYMHLRTRDKQDETVSSRIFDLLRCTVHCRANGGTVFLIPAIVTGYRVNRREA